MLNLFAYQRLIPFLLLLVVGLLGASGCKKGPTMVPVRGKVLFKDGTLIKRGVREIRFEPMADTTAVMRKTAIGQIKDDGSFELFTRRPGDGVIPGKYAVVISVLRGARDPVLLIDETYAKSATTPYHETVEHAMDGLLYHVEPIASGANTAKPATPAAPTATGTSG